MLAAVSVSDRSAMMLLDFDVETRWTFVSEAGLRVQWLGSIEISRWITFLKWHVGYCQPFVLKQHRCNSEGYDLWMLLNAVSCLLLI